MPIRNTFWDVCLRTVMGGTSDLDGSKRQLSDLRTFEKKSVAKRATLRPERAVKATSSDKAVLFRFVWGARSAIGGRVA